MVEQVAADPQAARAGEVDGEPFAEGVNRCWRTSATVLPSMVIS